MDTTSPDVNPSLIQFGNLARTCVDGGRQPYANLHEIEKAMRLKQNDIKNQTIKKAILRWKRHLAAFTQQDRYQFSISLLISWTLIKAVDNSLNTIRFFCILTCSTALLNILVKVWNVNVDFYVRINEGSLNKTYIQFDLVQFKFFHSMQHFLFTIRHTHHHTHIIYKHKK